VSEQIRRPYDAERLAIACDELGWSSGELARRLNIREDSVRQYISGKRNIPDGLGVWLDACVEIARTMPKHPEGWRAVEAA
jgi:ribosome-binding protein aMBF1 (putative translation factor)